jgi:transcription elongation GreA/GreB family factor
VDKRDLIEQLCEHLRATARVASRASADAEIEARDGATPAEKREDARVALEQAGLARGQKARAERAMTELRQLETFIAPRLDEKAKIVVGALVEVEDDDGEGRTFFLAPVGAGASLTGPGGDGLFTVVTPSSPVGKAVVGRKCGDTIDVTVDGDVREWTITWVA